MQGKSRHQEEYTDRADDETNDNVRSTMTVDGLRERIVAISYSDGSSDAEGGDIDLGPECQHPGCGLPERLHGAPPGEPPNPTRSTHRFERENMTKVLTLGTFDLFHVGHVELLQACRYIAGPDGTVVVGLNTDEFVKRYKGVDTFHKLPERIVILEAIQYVNAVIVNWGEENSWPIIESSTPDYLAIGDDWRDRNYLGQLRVTQEQLDSIGCQVIYVPRTTGQSSTKIRERLCMP